MMGQGPCVSPLRLKILRPKDSKLSPRTLSSKCLMKCPGRPGSMARMPGFTPWPPWSVCGATQHPGLRRVWCDAAAWLAEVRSRHNARVRWPGVHSRTRPLAQRAARPPGSRGELGAAGATMRGALCNHPQVNMLGSKPGSHTTRILHGDGEFGVRVAQKL
jgi:hypothetical protein